MLSNLHHGDCSFIDIMPHIIKDNSELTVKLCHDDLSAVIKSQWPHGIFQKKLNFAFISSCLQINVISAGCGYPIRLSDRCYYHIWAWCHRGSPRGPKHESQVQHDQICLLTDETWLCVSDQLPIGIFYRGTVE